MLGVVKKQWCDEALRSLELERSRAASTHGGDDGAANGPTSPPCGHDRVQVLSGLNASAIGRKDRVFS